MLSNDVRSTPAEILAYFEEFVNKDPKASIDEKYIRRFSDIAVNSGIYTFLFGTSTTSTQARFSFVYRFDGNQWLIMEHHSSLLYKEPSKENEKFFFFNR